MSKIVDRVIVIPEGVYFDYDEESRNLSINGPNGSFSLIVHPLVGITTKKREIRTTPLIDSCDKHAKALTGTMNSIIFNAINGSVEDHKRALEIKGVGYRASVSSGKINIFAGYSHEVVLDIPENIKIECLNNNRIVVGGSDKQKVGWFASKIRDIRRPNVFVRNLKGIFYEEEIPDFKLKAGKRDSKK